MPLDDKNDNNKILNLLSSIVSSYLLSSKTENIFKILPDNFFNNTLKEKNLLFKICLVDNKTIPLCLLVVSLPQQQIDYPIFLEELSKEIKYKKSKYLITWNIKEAILWRAPEGDDKVSERIKNYLPNNKIVPDGKNILTVNLKSEVENRLAEILSDLDKLHTHGHLYLIDIEAGRFVVRLTAAANNIWPSVKKSLATTTNRDRDFKVELEKWAAKQSIVNIDDVFYEQIARQTTYRILGKIIFYQSLRGQVKELEPIDFKGVDLALIWKKLKDYFEEARKIDYQAVFEEDIPEKIPFPQPALEELKSLIDDLNRYNFASMPQDVIGEVFEKLIPPEERHLLGQYFTPENLVDIVNAFCIKSINDKVLDPTCGTGTFLIRAYNKAQTQGLKDHKKLIKQLWGVDIAPFPAELATINLYRQKLSDFNNFPRIISEDFFNIRPKQIFKFPPPNPPLKPKEFIEETFPIFDAAVGNFPYVRQELIEKKVKGYKDLLEATIAEDWLREYREIFDSKGRLKLSGQADIYAYLFFHTAPFVKEDGGRLGFVTSNAWLDVEYGYEMQKFFLQRFKIIAILESRCEPWFEDAAVNTIVTILERCVDEDARNNNIVKFVKIKKKLSELAPWNIKTDGLNRWSNLEKMAQRIEKTGSEYVKIKDGKAINSLQGQKSYEDEHFRIRILKQAELISELGISGKTVKWGRYLRAPEVYFDLFGRNKAKFIILNDIADIKRGFTTGINEFFYPSKDQIQTFKIEKEFLKLVLKSPREVEGILIDKSSLTTQLFFCNKTKAELKKDGKRGALSYIEWGEKQKTDDGIFWPDVPSVSGRKQWYTVDTVESYLVWASTSRERLKIMVNKDRVIIDKVMYGIEPQEKFSELLPIILNSSLIHLFVEVNPSLLLAPGGIFTTVEDVKNLLVPNIFTIDKSLSESLLKVFSEIASRPTKSIFEELKMQDRRELDEIILEAIGINSKKYIKLLYEGLEELVKERIELAEIRKDTGGLKKGSKSKVKDFSAIKEYVIKMIFQNGARKFPEDFFEPKEKSKEIEIPNEPLKLGKFFFGTQEVISDSGFVYKAQNPTEAKYLIYSQRPEVTKVKIAVETIAIFRMVKEYENYIRKVKNILFEEFYNRTQEHELADRLTKEVLQKLDVPDIQE